MRLTASAGTSAPSSAVNTPAEKKASSDGASIASAGRLPAK
ncbi:MAG: hypothetical protein R3E41_13250 [Burkholderiaceae bacterium]